MPIVRHISGGAVSFVANGQRVNAGPGFIGAVPQRILDRFKKRFEVIDDLPFDRVTADVKQGEAVTREPVAAQQKTPLGRFLARHRGAGKWAVTKTETGEVVSEMMPRADAEKLADEMNSK